MDCYMGRSFEDLVVPSYHQESSSSSSQTYPCNTMWGGWNMNSHEATEKCFDYNTFNGEGFLCNQMGMKMSEEEDDLQGIEHMDDIYLNSILEDVPENDGDVQNSIGSSSMYGNREVTMFNTEAMPIQGEAPFTISDLSEENILDSFYGNEPSSEEAVLQDLQIASGKLTDETRRCFRDTFYRLARNSRDEVDSFSNKYGYSDAAKLSKENEMESETNSIDRAIANLTFNQMESNINNFPLPERVH